MQLSRTLADLHVRYNSILFPFDTESLIQNLPNMGYILRQEAAHALSGRPFLGRAVPAGGLATKGDVTLWVSYDRNSLGLRGPDCKPLIEGMGILEDWLSQEFGFAGQENALFYETQYEARVLSESSPLQSIERHFSKLPLISKLGDAVGSPLTNFTLRLVPPEVEPNVADWLDIRIEPEVVQPNRYWSVHILFRNQSRDKTFQMAERAQALTQLIVTTMEG